MSMMRKLFRPRGGTQGALPQRFTSAFVNGTAVYKGDLVHYDTTAPTDQGASGVLEGVTLLANDFGIFVRHAAATTEAGLQAGIVDGTSIGDPSANTSALTNDTLAIIQTWGVRQKCWVDSTDTAAGSKLTCAATTGECTYLAAYAVTATNVADGALVGVAMTTDTADFVRGTATAEEQATVFIRCDF